MNKTLAICLILFSHNALACRAPNQVDGAVIKLTYLDTPGHYSVTLPARMGESGKAITVLAFKDKDASKYALNREVRAIELAEQDAMLTGSFIAFQKEGHDAYIRSLWPDLPCPAVALKKIALLPDSSKH